MGRQKENIQSKEMEGSPLKELNEMEVTKLSSIEIKLMIMKMLKELSKNYISMKKEIEPINKNEEEMKNKTS